jgi:FMN phosphatase YigB (HAD superfamily)
VEYATQSPLNSKKAVVTLLLFDLDDTLLGNEMNTFIPAYLQALAKRLSSVAAPDLLVRTLLSATHQMVENRDPEETLEQIFDAAFYPQLGITRQQVQETIDTFYCVDFPNLKGLTQVKPEAAGVLDSLLKRGDRAAIATNPLFPRTAIEQRLDWAGLPVDQVPFVLIPSYETFHFAKPNPAYFAEFMGQLGWPKSTVLMVGNDVESDMGAAMKLGLPVFWATKNGASAWNGQGDLPPHGELGDLIPWMESSDIPPLPVNFNTSEALLAVLSATPAALATLTEQKPDNLGRQPAPHEWSPGEVFCHLRDVDEEVNLWRIKKVLNEHNPFIPGKDTDPWAETRQYQSQDCLDALTGFIKARKQVLNILENLPEKEWDRPARHAIFGPTTLRELVNIVAGHDILHIQQVFKAL